MKPFIFCGICLCAWNALAGAAPQSAKTSPRIHNTSPRRAQALHFRRGATLVSVRGFLAGSQSRFYTVQLRAGQKLRISAAPASKNPNFHLVPRIAVTPPRGHFNGDKTPITTSNFTRAGIYQIRVSPNLMASNARSDYFLLRVSAR